MQIKIAFNCDNAAFQDDLFSEISNVLDSCKEKIFQQLERTSALCKHFEASDKVQDSNGNTIGTITVED